MSVQPTWADVYFAGILGHLNAMTKINVIDGYPYLQKVNDGVLEHPAIKEWVKTRGLSSAEFFFSLQIAFAGNKFSVMMRPIF